MREFWLNCKQKKLLLQVIFLSLSLFFGGYSCSSGSSANNQGYGYNGYYQFSESNITMQIGTSIQVTLSLIDGISNTVNISTTEPGIVGLNPPQTCYLSGNPLSCNIIITGTGIGTTQVGCNYGSGQLLTITVTN